MTTTPDDPLVLTAEDIDTRNGEAWRLRLSLREWMRREEPKATSVLGPHAWTLAVVSSMLLEGIGLLKFRGLTRSQAEAKIRMIVDVVYKPDS